MIVVDIQRVVVTFSRFISWNDEQRYAPFFYIANEHSVNTENFLEACGDIGKSLLQPMKSSDICLQQKY